MIHKNVITDFSPNEYSPVIDPSAYIHPLAAEQPRAEGDFSGMVVSGSLSPARYQVNLLVDHAGTHADAPAHMLPGAAAITDMGIASFVFSRPGLVDVPKSDSEMIFSREVRHREAEIIPYRIRESQGVRALQGTDHPLYLCSARYHVILLLSTFLHSWPAMLIS